MSAETSFKQFVGSSKAVLVLYLILAQIYSILCILRIFRRKNDTQLSPSIFHPLIEILLKVFEIDMAPAFLMFAISITLGCTFIFEVKADDLLNPSAVLALHRKQDDGQWQAEAPAPRPRRGVQLPLL